MHFLFSQLIILSFHITEYKEDWGEKRSSFLLLLNEIKRGGGTL